MPDELRVYLDHHIERENLRYKRSEDKIESPRNDPHTPLRLFDFTRREDHYLMTHYLRKPDFQRATWAWTPEDCVLLLESVINYQVVPSIIMWISPDNGYRYILDGGHRISVIKAWIEDDWGESQASNFYNPTDRQFQ